VNKELRQQKKTIQRKFEKLAACQEAAGMWIYCALFEVMMTAAVTTPTPIPTPTPKLSSSSLSSSKTATITTQQFN
jgi:hypothetical protein